MTKSNFPLIGHYNGEPVYDLTGDAEAGHIEITAAPLRDTGLLKEVLTFVPVCGPLEVELASVDQSDRELLGYLEDSMPTPRLFSRNEFL